jgi:hypothetical protein
MLGEPDCERAPLMGRSRYPCLYKPSEVSLTGQALFDVEPPGRRDAAALES